MEWGEEEKQSGSWISSLAPRWFRSAWQRLGIGGCGCGCGMGVGAGMMLLLLVAWLFFSGLLPGCSANTGSSPPAQAPQEEENKDSHQNSSGNPLVPQ